jgi:hypothetical protein
MTVRTFKQFGQAYGQSPVTLVAKVDGVEVFNGVTPTLNEPYKLTGFDFTLYPGNELFSWTDDVNFIGTKTIEITVGAGSLIFMNTTANYPSYGQDKNSDPANQWLFVYANIVDDILYSNPISNLTINGQAQTIDVPTQTCWLVPPNGVLSCTVNVTKGFIPYANLTATPG